MTIPMTARHIEMIKAGEKTSTLRSLKEVYPLIVNELPDGTRIRITDSRMVLVSMDRICDVKTPDISWDLNYLAYCEGYSSWPEVVAELRKMRHKLPKTMWLYTFEVVR